MNNNTMTNGILTLYFSGTGNTKYIAEKFSNEMGAACFSIEDNANFTQELKNHDTIVFCYPIYGSRVPRIMREFAKKHMSDINGKKVIILVTQVLFSGDGARVFTDLFWEDSIEVIYAEHIRMPNNVNNVPIFWKTGDKTIKRYVKRADSKLLTICDNIRAGIIKQRGFSRCSQTLGSIQGKFWQGNSKEIESGAKSIEEKIKNRVTILSQCTACNLCVELCPVKNFINNHGRIIPQGNCIACYRCINRCPSRAISVWNNVKPKWQYPGINNKG